MSDLRHYWNDLTATALVGSARQPALPPAPAAPAGLADLLAGLSDADPAERLLSAAAAVGLALQTGALPTSAPAEPITPAFADERARCSQRSADHLEALLAGRQRLVLPEWLRALNASGRRPPETAIPALLDAGRNDVRLRPLIVAATGPAGAWLGQLNPDWAFATAGAAGASASPAELGELWQTSTRNGRQFLLQSLRASDPEQARELITSTWTSDKADERAAFVEALATNLGPADEPLLEAALNDRGKEVRAHAATLLSRLPGSQLAGRMAARALALLRYHGGLMPRIEVELPAECDRALQRDGVDPKPPSGTGERAWWLAEIVRRTPPATFSRAWGQPPARIIAARMPKDWRALLIGAWSTAAVTYADAEWATALAELAPREQVPIGALIPLMPAERREPLLIQLLADKKPLGRDSIALSALRATRAPWSLALGRAAIAALERSLRRLGDDSRGDWHLRVALEELALTIPAELAEQAIAALPSSLNEAQYWVDTFHAFSERMRLRRDMLAALREV